MKKALSILLVFFLALTFLFSSPFREEDSPYTGTWKITQNCIESFVRFSLLRDGIRDDNDFYSFYLSNGKRSLSDTLGDITLVLGKNSRGTYSDGNYNVNFDYTVTRDERHLIFSNKDIWDNDAFYGTFNEEGTKLFLPNGLFLEKVD